MCHCAFRVKRESLTAESKNSIYSEREIKAGGERFHSEKFEESTE